MSGAGPKPLVDSEELPPDTRLLGGRLVVDVRIGSGGASTVYAATTLDGRDVALKIMSADHAERATSRRRLENEVALAQHLADHPRVVTPYAMGELPELGGRPYITMPLVTGRSLLLLVGRLPLHEAVALLRDLARTVADVHDRGIVHRDIKPGNVIVREHGERRVPYLIDFGLAHGTGHGTAPMSARLTAAHELPGTKHYMAPEQILGAPPDPRFDVYALGITMVEVITGLLPLHELSPADAARRKCDAGQASLSIAGRGEGLPVGLERAIDGALEREPAERTASARRLAEQLGAVLDDLRSRGAGPIERCADASGEWFADAPTERLARAPTEGLTSVPTEGLVEAPTRVARRPPESPRRWLGLGVVAAVVGMTAVGLGGAGSPLPVPPPVAEAVSPEVEPVMVGIVTMPGGAVRSGGVPEQSETGAPELEVEPEIAPIRAKPSPVPRARRRPSRRRARRRPIDCVEQLARAQAASRERQWQAVLDLTAPAECWDASDEARIWLRVEALSELGRYPQCAALGRPGQHPEIARMVRSCAAQQQEEVAP